MLTRAEFPPSFQFGAATSAYQIEGHSFGGAGKTHWDSFAATPGNVVNAENGAVACDHFHRFEQDLNLLQGFDSYRFSTSWARVLPEGRGQVNQAGLDFYDRLVDTILERHLKPFLTLYHWELPAALAAMGGWTNREIAHWFGDFADVVMARLGDRVASVATINEPWCVSYLSHYLGHHAPGVCDINATARAVHHVLLAHGEATGRMRARGQQEIGIVVNFEALKPHRPVLADQMACDRYDAVMNRLFIQPLMTGSYPELAMQGIGAHMPDRWQDDMALIAQPLDWLGVNYYTRKIVREDANGSWPNVCFETTKSAKTQMGWDICPQGLGDILCWLADEFTGDLPLYVTENGMAWDDQVVDGVINDTERMDYISAHLEQVHAAIDKGLNIKGFFYWSLLDNFEWAYGYDKRFGLIHVDFGTQIRTPKNSFHMLKNAISP